MFATLERGMENLAKTYKQFLVNKNHHWKLKKKKKRTVSIKTINS